MYFQVFEGTSEDMFHTRPFLRAGTGVGADGGWVVMEVVAINARHIREFFYRDILRLHIAWSVIIRVRHRRSVL